MDEAVPGPAAEAGAAVSGPACSWGICWGTATEEAAGGHPHRAVLDPGLPVAALVVLAVSTVVGAALEAAVSAEAEAASMVAAAPMAVEPEDKD